MERIEIIMKLFKTQDNQIFAYELDGSQDHLIGDKTLITQEEADVLIENKRNSFVVPSELQAAKDAKASAIAKLTALGLTEDEVKALLG